MPSTSTIRSFYDDYLHRLDKNTIRHQFVCDTFDTMNLNGKNILDLGCGTGITTKHLAKRANSVIGVDLSAILIEYAKSHNHSDNIQYLVADATEWNYPYKFDVISMVDIFEHIPEDRLPNLMSTVKSVVHDDTEIYLNIPTGDVLRYLRKNRPELMQIVDVPHDDVLTYFKSIEFIPIYFKLYWCQYVEYIFKSENVVNRIFDTVFRKE